MTTKLKKVFEGISNSNLIANTTVTFNYDDLQEAFPEVDPQHLPCGNKVLLQVRSPKIKTSGGIWMPDESLEAELWNTQTAKVIALGPLAYMNRDTMEPWPEGQWCKVGDYVRIPKYHSDRWIIEYEKGQVKHSALFVIIKDTEVLGKIVGNPLNIKAVY